MHGMLAPKFEEKYLGNAVVKQAFQIKKVGTIAGCFVEKGYDQRIQEIVRLYRNDIMIHEGNIFFETLFRRS